MPPRSGYVCPACGFPELNKHPWLGRSASDEICVSCGIHFGYDDAAGGDSATRETIYIDWRARWIARGCPWFSSSTPMPDMWDANAQLQRVSEDQQR